LKTVDMRRSDRQKKAETAGYAVGPAMEGADYAHGLHLRLHEPELAKIGITGMPKPGDVYRVEGEMKVTSAEGRDSENAGSTRCIEFVLHRLGAEPKASRPGPRETSVREDLEDVRHQARGSTVTSGSGAPIGARFNTSART
jgi:hypothetical protein